MPTWPYPAGRGDNAEPRGLRYWRSAYPAVMRRPGNPAAIASLVLGITSIVFFWWGMVTLAQVVLAIVFGVHGMNLAKRYGARYRSLAIAGLICGCVGGLVYLTLGLLSGGIYFVY